MLLQQLTDDFQVNHILVETQHPFTHVGWKGGDKSIGWGTKKQLLLLCQAEGATAGSRPQDCKIHAGGGREFYTVQGAGVNSLQTSLGLVSIKVRF